MPVPTVSLEGTRARLVASGRSLVAKQGLRSLTTSAIAERARISKKTLYRCFASKDDLVDAVLISFLEENLARWDATLDDESAPVMERIERSLDCAARLLPEIQAHVLDQIGPGAMPLTLWAKIDALRLARLAKFRHLMEEAQREGYIRADVDPDHWLSLLIGSVQSVLVPSVLLERGISLPDIVRSLKAIYFDGLLTEKGRRYAARRRKEGT